MGDPNSPYYGNPFVRSTFLRSSFTNLFPSTETRYTDFPAAAETTLNTPLSRTKAAQLSAATNDLMPAAGRYESRSFSQALKCGQNSLDPDG